MSEQEPWWMRERGEPVEPPRPAEPAAPAGPAAPTEQPPDPGAPTQVGPPQVGPSQYGPPGYGPPPYGPAGFPWSAGGAYDAPPARRGARPSGALLVVVGVLIAVVAGSIGAAIGVHVEKDQISASAVSVGGGETPVVDARGGSASQTRIEAVAKAVSPCVVLISETTPTLEGTGSGIVVRTDGYILTNNHVVSAAAHEGSISVTFADGTTVPARIVGRDPSSDLAVIKVTGVDGLTAARLGNSATAVVGETVLAFGSPLGLQSTVTEGIVSAVNRPVFTSDSSLTDTNAVIDAIQTDAAINPGNSGGPLVNTSGEVIGLDSAIATVGSSSSVASQSGNIGIGFAIPINSARVVADQLIAVGHAIHAELGVKGSDANDDAGAVVVSVAPGSGAARAGLHPGDVVTAVDGSPVPNFDTLVVDIRNHQPGQTVSVTFRRDGLSYTVAVTLGSVVN